MTENWRIKRDSNRNNDIRGNSASQRTDSGGSAARRSLRNFPNLWSSWNRKNTGNAGTDSTENRETTDNTANIGELSEFQKLRRKKVTSQDGSDTLYGSRKQRVEGQLDPRFDTAQKELDKLTNTPEAAAGFKGQTRNDFIEKYQKDVRRGEVEKTRTLLFYKGKSLQLDKSEVTRPESQKGHNSFWKTVRDLETKQKELQVRTNYRDTLRSQAFDQRSPQDRYELLAEASQLYTQDFEEILKGLKTQRQTLRAKQRGIENSNDEPDLNRLEAIKTEQQEIERQRKEIESSIVISQRYLKKMDPLKEPAVAPHIDKSIQLLRESTMQQIDTLERLWRGDDLKVQDGPDAFQDETFQQQFERTGNANERKSLMWNNYARQGKKAYSLRYDLRDLYEISPKTPTGNFNLDGTPVYEKAILRKVADLGLVPLREVESVLIQNNQASAVEAFKQLDQTIDNMSSMHEQFQRFVEIDKNALSDSKWIEQDNHMKHLKEISEQSSEQSDDLLTHIRSASERSGGDLPSLEEFQEQQTKMETARKKFLTQEALLTNSHLREQALEEYQAAAEGMSQIHQRLETFISRDYSETSTIQEETNNEITPQMLQVIDTINAVVNYYRHQRERS